MQGDYFGEIALLTHTTRTATVKSSNYCTMASLSKEVFYDLCNRFTDIFLKLKLKGIQYNDQWKRFKLKLLEQVDYFNNFDVTPELMDEIHY